MQAVLDALPIRFFCLPYAVRRLWQVAFIKGACSVLLYETEVRDALLVQLVRFLRNPEERWRIREVACNLVKHINHLAKVGIPFGTRLGRRRIHRLFVLLASVFHTNAVPLTRSLQDVVRGRPPALHGIERAQPREDVFRLRAEKIERLVLGNVCLAHFAILPFASECLLFHGRVPPFPIRFQPSPW